MDKKKYEKKLSELMIENQDREYFNGICPYTDNTCDDWHCRECEVEQREREWMEGEEE